MIARREPSARAVARAEAFLRKHLADGPVPSGDVIRKASDNGIPRRTLEAAKYRVARSFRPDGNYDSRDRSGWWMELIEGDSSVGEF